MRSIKGKTALVTGASSGIGEAFARELAKQGCHLILTARSEDKLQTLARALRDQYQVHTTVITANLAAPEGAGSLFAQIQQPVDILVNNAGSGKWAHFMHEPLQVYRDMMQLNMDSLLQLTYLLLPGMLERGSGGIINIGSTASFQPCPYIAVYAATKAFVLSFSEALYGEFKDRGITVTAVCPGNTESNFAKEANANIKGMPIVTSQRVAKEGIAAFMKRKNYTVTGGIGNYLQTLSPRMLPRTIIINIVGGLFRNKVRPA